MAGGGGGEDGDFGFQIAPMVDVVFVLLLFFMACAGTKQTEGFLTIALPSRPSADQEIAIPITIDIDNTGNVFIGAEAKGSASTPSDELDALTEQLTRAVASGSQDPVVIRPALEAQHEWIIKVLNCCRKAKVVKLSFS